MLFGLQPVQSRSVLKCPGQVSLCRSLPSEVGYSTEGVDKQTGTYFAGQKGDADCELVCILRAARQHINLKVPND